MSYTLLFVDDDEDDVFMFCDAAMEFNEVYCSNAKNGEDAFRLLEVVEELPDVIVLDINMPKVSGWDLLKKLAAHPRFSTIPVFMYSTSSLAEEKERARRLGAKDYFVKPSETEGIRACIQSILDYLDSAKTTRRARR